MASEQTRQKASTDDRQRARNDAELKAFLLKSFGVALPDTQVCPNHSTPFRAFADAYFARYGVTVWKASRGLGGKSYLLALLGHCEADTLDAEVTVLGGSGEQAQRVIEYLQKFSGDEENTKRRTDYSGGGRVTALMASSKSARGPHPQRMRLDEVDEMDLAILDAAMGQPMEGKGIAKQTVMSSTHHYPDATFTEVLKRAQEKGWPVYEWSIAQGTRVLSQRGWVPIETLDRHFDCVMTRKGWRRLKHVTWMGSKPTRTLRLSNGCVIAVTLDHRMLTPDGWVRAGQLSIGDTLTTCGIVPPETNTAMPSVVARGSVSIFGSVFVPGRATGLCYLCSDVRRTLHVDSVSNSLQVFRTDAGPAAASVVRFKSFGDWPNPNAISKAVRTLFAGSGINDTVSIRVDPKSPHPTVTLNSNSSKKIVSVEGHGIAPSVDTISASLARKRGSSSDSIPAMTMSHVVSISDGAIAVPVWDIGVDGDHEFIAEGIVVHNCYKETSAEPDGWLSQTEIESKRGEVTDAMWKAEYDLQEPSPEGRAILPEKVDACFKKELGEYEGRLGETLIIEEPEPNAKYATGCDWAKKKDFTIIDTFRIDVRPMRRVCWTRTGRLPWPMMVAKFDAQVKKYPGPACHDATGIGDAPDDYKTVSAEGVVMVGQRRGDIFTNYIAAIEGEHLVSAKIRYCEGEHRYCTNEDLNGGGHPPDSFVAGALAYRASQSRDRYTEADNQSYASQSY